MATTLITPDKQHLRNTNRFTRKHKSYTQTVSTALGCLMIVVGLSGFLNPEFMGMHLSVMHSFVLSGSGALCIWASNSYDSRKAYYANLLLAFFFAANAIAGFLLGGPDVGGSEVRNALLFRMAPGFVELGLVDHCVHAFLSIFFFTGAFSWKRHHRVPRERT